MSAWQRFLSIAASAGSGKTFRLAHRYIALLAAGVAPERIIAVTFSRKAAGEIFDDIVSYLCNAATDPERAVRTGQQIGRPGTTCGEFQDLLRHVVEAMNKLRIQTLDSFTVGIVRSFPNELGLSGDLEILDDQAGARRRVRDDVFGELFSTRRENMAGRQAFIAAFRRATAGDEGKGMDQRLDDFIAAFHRNYYLIAPHVEQWGNEAVIWPGGAPWQTGDEEDVSTQAEALMASITSDQFTRKDLPGKLHELVSALAEYGMASRWDEGRFGTVLFRDLFAQLPRLLAGAGSITYYRKEYELTPGQCERFARLLLRLCWVEMRRALDRTGGIHELMDQYEVLYDRIIRRRGRLTFTDAQYLLGMGCDAGAGPTRNLDERLYIDYRLDCRLDHWLIDEFQDTSDLQWRVIANLIDEVLFDSGGERSFFYVGDVKQAIYGWRGGNPRLFHLLREHYQERLSCESLPICRRCPEPVVEAVNRVFGGLPSEELAKEAVLPAEGVARWENIWEEHEWLPGNTHGYAALRQPKAFEEGGRAGEAERFRATAQLLTEIAPLRRGLSVAVLVRSNRVGLRVVNCLREACPGLAVAFEGKAALKDSVLVRALLALIRVAAHPGDMLAWRHVQMSPLGVCLEQGEEGANSLPMRLLAELEENGYESFIRHWSARIEEHVNLDAFGRKRLEDLIEATARFDCARERSVDDFLAFIDDYEFTEPAQTGAVRVMTVHQSKGLGFDVVILPDLQPAQSQNLAKASGLSFAVKRDPDADRPEWILKLPPRIIAESDPVLAAQVAVHDGASCFEELCVLYVAMTRAQRALYMIVTPPGKSATSIKLAALLTHQLASSAQGGPSSDGEVSVLFERGEAGWFAAYSLTEPTEEELQEGFPDGFARGASQRTRLVRVSPSQAATEQEAAKRLFSQTGSDARDFGTALHSFFEQVAWIDEMDLDTTLAEWEATGGKSFSGAMVERVAQTARRLWKIPAMYQALARPSPYAELWREQSFEAALGRKWLTGVFDRVVIERGEDGLPKRATIIDFKSDDLSYAALEERVRHHDVQLRAYGRVLCQMLQLPPTAIELCLIFSEGGYVSRWPLVSSPTHRGAAPRPGRGTAP